MKILDFRIKKIERWPHSPFMSVFYNLNSIILILIYTILPTKSALAADSDIKLTLPESIKLSGEGGFNKLWTDVSGLVLAFLAAAAFIGIVYSGVMMITAGGDATKFAAGKKNLIWSIIGIIIVVLSYFIIRFVYNLTGGLVGAPTP